MTLSELVKLLEEQLVREGDGDVLLNFSESDYLHDISGVSGRWSALDRSRYDGSPIRHFIHASDVEGD